MLTKIQKWGNSLALRIPKAFAADVQLTNDSLVEVTVIDGQILIKPIVTVDWTLEQLLADIDEKNIHNEVNSGPAMGKEIW